MVHPELLHHIEFLVYGWDHLSVEAPGTVDCELPRFRATLNPPSLVLYPLQPYEDMELAIEHAEADLATWEAGLGMACGSSIRFHPAYLEMRRGERPAGTKRWIYSSQPKERGIFYLDKPRAPGPYAGIGVEMWRRHRRFLEGVEPLQGNGYAVLTVLEASAGRLRPGAKKRASAANTFNIEERILNLIGELSSERGSPATARKLPSEPLTQGEDFWLRVAIPALCGHITFRAPAFRLELPLPYLGGTLQTPD